MTGIPGAAMLALGVMGAIATVWAVVAEMNLRQARRTADRYWHAWRDAERRAKAARRPPP